MTRVKSLIVWFALLQGSLACAQPSLLSTSENTLAVAPNVILAGSLTGHAPNLLKQSNAIVIDLRRADEGIEAEANRMQSMDIPYFNLPVTAGALDRKTVSRLDTLLNAHTNRPIVVHCQSGNRAGLLWAALLKERGYSSDAAESAVASIVTKTAIRQAIHEYSIEATP